MNDIFDRHSAKLTPEERRAVWERVSAKAASMPRAPRARFRWRAPVAAALGLAGIAVFLIHSEQLRSQRQLTIDRLSTMTEMEARRLEPGPDSSRPGEPLERRAIVSRKSDAQTAPTEESPQSFSEKSTGSQRLAVIPPPPPDAAPARPAAPVDKQITEVKVMAQRMIDTKSSATSRPVTGEGLKLDLPVEGLKDAVGLKAGIVTQEGNLRVRGGRGGEAHYQVDGIELEQQITDPPGPPNEHAFDAMFFRDYGVNPFIPADEDPWSTFAVDVDAASYTLARRYLDLGQLPPAEAVRVEEFVNYFPQEYPSFQQDDFRILIDGAPSPFGPGYQLLRVGLKGREVAKRDRKPASLTFVIDVSGSMMQENRLELVKEALRLLVDELKKDDRVGIVAYGSRARVVLDPVSAGSDRRRILSAIEELQPNGSTNAEDGLRLGYDMARRGDRAGAINRLVLCSDGVANVGRTGPEEILKHVRSEADRGVQLTTIGFGMGNYNDVLMEQLADRGDGNHYYVDDLHEARRVFSENLTGTLQIIAKDAKVQVEFDSTRVLRYRLLGFENRDVADRDFRNDQVDAGEIGAGHEVTALYEVKLAPKASQGPLATVRLRYAKPEHDAGGAAEVREIQRTFNLGDLTPKFERTTPRFRMDAAVAEFAEILRGSYWAKDGRLADVLAVARNAAPSLPHESSQEFIALVEKAAALRGNVEAGSRVER